LEVTGGTYYRTYDVPLGDAGWSFFAIPNVVVDGGPTGEADPATVSDFKLDTYLVTVGRFRQFVSAWNGGAGWLPPAGSGKHTHLNGGQGLSDVGAAVDGGAVYELGWLASDDSNIAPTNADLTCDPEWATWTPSAAGNENLPINCVNWYESYAFCIWDGGFLPSEAEWEYAAAGGSQQREYPWGSTAPGTTNQYAILGDGNQDCYYPNRVTCTGVANFAPVGTPSQGAGLWGQLDLEGEAPEWTLDWFAPYVDPCIDGANLAGPDARGLDSRVVLGIGAAYGLDMMAVPYRNASTLNAFLPDGRGQQVGFRCARTP
jgi:sulfatase modifying factor 1